jgi:hypothetical protein
MASKQFLRLVGAGFALVASLIIGTNVHEDIYGLFKSARGRVLNIYGEERTAKYLLSFRYIPENFDGILLGSSVSDNLETKDFPGYHVYNASINGGNTADLIPIAGNVFREGRFKLTIICIHRYLTNDHLAKTDLMTPRQYWGALGSPQLTAAYLSRLASQRGIVSSSYNEYGTFRFMTDDDTLKTRKEIDEAVAEVQEGTASVGNYQIDPIAFADLGDLIRTARNRSDRLVIFYPPIPAPILAIRSKEFMEYTGTMNQLVDPKDVVVDFNAPEYENMRADYRNFVDAVHLSSRGAQQLMRELSKAIGSADDRRASLH